MAEKDGQLFVECLLYFMYMDCRRVSKEEALIISLRTGKPLEEEIIWKEDGEIHINVF